MLSRPSTQFAENTLYQPLKGEEIRLLRIDSVPKLDDDFSYFICTLKEPYDLYTETPISLYTNIPRFYSQWLRILIVQCCQNTPVCRPSASQIEHAASTRDEPDPGQRDRVRHLGADLMELLGL